MVNSAKIYLNKKNRLTCVHTTEEVLTTTNNLNTQNLTYLRTIKAKYEKEVSTALDVKLCLVTNGHLYMFDQVLYAVKCINWCIYAFFINDQNIIRKDCFLKH